MQALTEQLFGTYYYGNDWSVTFLPVITSKCASITVGALALLTVFTFTTAAQPPSGNSVEEITRQIQEGHFQAAKTQLEQELRADPKRPELWNLLGIANGELGDAASAHAAFQRGLQIAPNSVSLHENTGFLYYREGDYAHAKTELARAVALGSDKPGVLFSLAASRLRTGDAKQSLADLKSLEPRLGNLSAYWDERGRAESVSDPAAAGQSFDRALQLQPNDVAALNGAASAAERQAQDEKALSYLIKARQAKPDDVETLAHFGSVCIRRDLGLDAIQALQHAHALAPSNNSVLFLLARANISVENWQKAYDLFDTLSKRMPDFAPAYYAMGWIDRKLSRTADARSKLEQCLKLAPKTTGAQFELANLELDDGHIDAAETLLRDVLREQPNHAQANTTMGDIMMRRGKLQQAQAFLQTAVRSDPKLAAAHYKLAILFSRLHQTEQAANERAIAGRLNEQAKHASKTQLRLILPESLEAR